MDATGAGPVGVPGPLDSLAFAQAAFVRAGFTQQEMIQAMYVDGCANKDPISNNFIELAVTHSEVCIIAIFQILVSPRQITDKGKLLTIFS